VRQWRRATVATPGEYNVKRLAVANGPNIFQMLVYYKKHLKNVAPIRHNEPPHAHSADVASGTVARRLRIDVHDDNDNDNA